MGKVYTPSQKILDKYADVLVKFALNGGKGIKKGDVVQINVPECAKPFLIALRKSVLKAGGNPMTSFSPDGIAKDFYELASEEQLKFFPAISAKAKVEQIDHAITVIADYDKHELKGIDPKKIMVKNKAWKPQKDWKRDKEAAGKYTWTLALYGTPAMAKEVGMSLKEYWHQIIKACFLDEKDPIAKWKKSMAEVERVKDKLNKLKIQKVRVRGEKTDLIVGIGKNRKWLGGSGRNIPSFEVFISPDNRIAEGVVHFNQPLYRYGTMAKDITVEMKNGKVVSVKAEQGENVLKEMMKVEGADRLGEFSLTDARLSRITKFMGETLYDENIGGKYGNMHIAFGSAYQDSFPGNASKISEKEWKEMGYNDSAIHTDIISTEDKEVIAFLEDGTERIIYRSGKFLV